jgi:Uma2 family endonuclease
MLATVTSGENRILLENISWQTFKTMLAEMGTERKTRLAYDHGNIEIVTPQMPHENSNRLIELFIEILCEELGLEVKSVGSLTLTRDDLERGAEPDSSFYIKNELLVRNKENIDLEIDPPPDLVVEVEYSKPKIDKLKLYAAMGIAEFWCYQGQVLKVYILQDGQYIEVENSPTFAPVVVKEIPRFIAESKQYGQISTMRYFRSWVQEQVQHNNHQ